MSVDNTTYNFCIESLRYIHKILGYDTIIQELNFIQHLSKPVNVPTIIDTKDIEMPPNIVIDTEVQPDTDIKETKNIVIENKYVRNELPDEKRCETILPTGKRCTFKKADNSVYCSRHTK